MPKVQAAIVSEGSITLMVDGQTTPITDSHHNYEEIRLLAAAGNYASIAPLLDIIAAVVDFGEGRVTVKDGQVLYDGKATHNAVTTRILQMVEEGLDVAPMIVFLDNLMDNPSYRSVQQLYGFLEVNDLPITEDGCFLAYKMCTRKDDGTLTDARTGTFDYSVGAPPATMPRNEVDEDPDRTCSSGLHVCAQEYLDGYSFGGVTLLVKVNPANVVAVPTDYHNAKMRVCEHETVCEVDGNTKGNVYSSALYTPTTDTNLAGDASVLSKEEAIIALDLQGATNPMAALRKRLNRAVTCKRVFVNGAEMVQLIDTEAEAEAEADETVMTHADAIAYFAKQNADAGRAQPSDAKAALRKRLNKSITAKRVYPNGIEMVKIID